MAGIRRYTRLPPWLATTDAQGSTIKLADDLSQLGFLAEIGHCRLGLAFSGANIVDWDDALGHGIQLSPTGVGREPTVDPTTGGIVFDGVADRMTSNADPLLDIGGGGSLITAASMTGVAGRGIAALFNPDGTKSLRVDTQSPSGIYQGHATTPTNVLTSATGGTVASAAPRLIDVGYTGGAPLTVRVSDTDARAQAGSAAAIPAGEAYQLELYHTRNANQSGGIIYAWLFVKPAIDAAARALIRAWTVQNFPGVVQFV